VADLLTTIRRNHALEHATVALLAQKLEGRVRLVGRAGLTGFYLYGDLPSEMVEEAAKEALKRLQRGQEELAFSPFCGTNLAVTAVLTALASLFLSRGTRGWQRLQRLIGAALVALLLAQPLGRLAQKYLTTSTDLAGVRIRQVIRRGEGRQTVYKVETVQL